jgi:hypothetical protein
MSVHLGVDEPVASLRYRSQPVQEQRERTFWLDGDALGVNGSQVGVYMSRVSTRFPLS